MVAAEVRKLAERSQVAAQEIGELAGSSVAAGREGRQAAGRDGAVDQEDLRPGAGDRRGLARSSPPASGQINAAMSQLNQTTQQNASASEELAATAEEMSGQAEQLQQLMGFFKVEGARKRTSPCARPVKKPRRCGKCRA